MKIFGIAVVAGLLATSAQAQTLSNAMAGVAFLIGDWHGGHPVQNGIFAHGTSHMHLVAGGTALLRQDRTDLADVYGRTQSSFDQIMLVYPEGGTLHADYFDNVHAIHYTRADVKPGEEVSFIAKATNTIAPDYRLTYRKTGPDTLSVLFESHGRGAPFVTIAAGTLKRE